MSGKQKGLLVSQTYSMDLHNAVVFQMLHCVIIITFDETSQDLPTWVISYLHHINLYTIFDDTVKPTL